MIAATSMCRRRIKRSDAWRTGLPPGRSLRVRVDLSAWILALPFLYAFVLFPIAAKDEISTGLVVDLAPSIADRVFWPLYAVFCVAVCVASGKLRLAIKALNQPHFRAIVAFMALAGASTLWSTSPEVTATRFALQLLILLIFVCASALAPRSSDFIGALFWVFAFGTLLNAFYVGTQAPHHINGAVVGYPGYFSNKNTLGFFSASALLLALTRWNGPPLRKFGAIIVILLSGTLLVLSQSKAALAFAAASPILAWLTVSLNVRHKVSPALTLFACIACFYLASVIVGDLVARISNLMYGNPTLSNRTVIWEYLQRMIDARPILGAGYRSVWLVPPNILAQYPAEPWIKLMPHGHNGYLDIRAELGYLGYGLLMWVILAVYHMAGRIARDDLWRGWTIITLATFCGLMNFVESSWFRGYDPLWMLFIICVVECARGAFATHGKFSGPTYPAH